MGDWKRTSKAYLTKTRKMTDGHLLHILSPEKIPINDFDERVYKSLQDVKATTSKFLVGIVGAVAFSLLTHFKVLKGITASGLELSPAIFSHAALSTLSVLTAAYCFSFCKQTYLQSWFSYKLKRGTPDQKAYSLLLYPDAYWHFAFLPASIGYPKYVFAQRDGWMQLIYLLLIIVGLAIYAGGFLWLWLILAHDVWISTQVSRFVSVCTLIASATCLVLGYLSPFWYDFPRRYTHYGLVNLLQRKEGASLQQAHSKIRAAAIRMNLVEKP